MGTRRYMMTLNGGGAKEDRTPDLLHAMQALSQLSYGPSVKPAILQDFSGLSSIIFDFL